MARFGKVFIIIDGLDECQSQVRLDLLKLVNEVLECHTGAQLLTSSRLVDAIGAYLHNPVELHVKAQENDIRSYIQGRLNDLDNLSRLIKKHPGLAVNIRDTLTGKAGGMWVVALNE